MIEKEDEAKVLAWEPERFERFMKKINPLNEDKECIYSIGLDIASRDSSDYSVMCHLELVDGKYEYRGCEII